MMTRSTQATPTTLRKSNLETPPPFNYSQYWLPAACEILDLFCRQFRGAAFWRFLVTLFLLKGAFRGILLFLVQREKQDSRFLWAFHGVAWRRALVPQGYYFSSFDAAENGKWNEPFSSKSQDKAFDGWRDDDDDGRSEVGRKVGREEWDMTTSSFFFLLRNSYNRFEALCVVDRFYEGILFGMELSASLSSNVLKSRFPSELPRGRWNTS